MKKLKALSKFDEQMDSIVRQIVRETMGEKAVKQVIKNQQTRRRFEQFILRTTKLSTGELMDKFQKQLLAHMGHEIEFNNYRSKQGTVACVTCSTVLKKAGQKPIRRKKSKEK
jgi:hypothetical protein